jgi:hypothetical protein
MSATNWEDVYRVQTARIAELEKENAALRRDKAELETDVAWWHKAYCSVGQALGINEPECSSPDFFAELVKELVAKNAALRKDKERLDYIFYPSCSMRARARMRKFIGTKPYLPPNGLCPWRAGIDDAMGVASDTSDTSQP